MNTYFREIENNIDNVLEILKNDEPLCNMIVDMMNTKCKTKDWRDERVIARNTIDNTHELMLKPIPNDLSDNYIPEYMVDFYNESSFTDDWKKLNNDEKLKILNADIENYMNK